MLAPIHKKLVPCSESGVTDGKYILWKSGHFVGVVVQAGACTVHDCNTGTHTYRGIPDLQDGEQRLWFRMVPSPNTDAAKRVAENRGVALKRKATTLRKHEEHATIVMREGLTPEQQRAARVSRAIVLGRRFVGGLRRPLPPSDWPQPAFPEAPKDFLTFQDLLPDVKWLRALNEHPRDHRLRFLSANHVYLVDGAPSLGPMLSCLRNTPSAQCNDQSTTRHAELSR